MAEPVWWDEARWERALPARLLAMAEALGSRRTSEASEAMDRDVRFVFIWFRNKARGGGTHSVSLGHAFRVRNIGSVGNKNPFATLNGA